MNSSPSCVNLPMIIVVLKLSTPTTHWNVSILMKA